MLFTVQILNPFEAMWLWFWGKIDFDLIWFDLIWFDLQESDSLSWKYLGI